MGLEFTWAWALLLLLPAVVLVLWIERRYRARSESLKRRVSLAVRLALVILLICAVASPSLLAPSGKTVRWVLLDVSDSAEPAAAAMGETLKNALEALPEGEEAGVIVFGGSAMVDTPLSAAPTFTGVHAAVNGDGSDLNGALMLAGALLPADGAGGITVLSDGRTQTDAGVIGMLKARGVKVDTYAFQTGELEDAQLSSLTAPAGAYKGQRLTVEAVIDANAAMEGTLVLYQNGEPTMTRDVKLEKGENRFAFSDIAKQTGVATYEARLLAGSDLQSRNNSAAAYVRITGAPQVMLVSQTNAIEKLFQAAGLNVSTLRPAELGDGAEDYLAYDAIILNNIDYDDATEAQWQALCEAVNTLGRGLCVLGGDSSFALGGYRGTVLEEALPVSIDVRDKLRMPALSLVIAIDKSGSMTMGQFGTSRIEVAKEAAMRAAEVLTERDKIGVIAFDDTAKWAVPFQNVMDVSAIQSQIGTIRADGGTAYFSAMSEAYTALAMSDTPQKHVIFLSDGEPGDTGYQDIALAMSKAGITLTTVAVGSDANTRLMSLLSTLGGGRSYAVGEFDNIPKIFTKETMLVSGNYIQNRIFTPVITDLSELTGFSGFPSLSGYLTTVEKPIATVSLTSDTEDPILAWWRFGAGKVVAWMSDAEGVWSEDFLQWQDAPSFFGGLVAKALPGSDRDGTLSAVAGDDGLKLTYTVDAADEGKLLTEAAVLSPDGTRETVKLAEVAPGQYEGLISAPVQGAYAFRVTQSDEAGTVVRSQESGAVKGYAREYDLRANLSADSLSLLSAETGGRILTGVEDFWDTAVEGVVARRRLQGLLALICLILFLCDIALRKLPWEETLMSLLGRQKAHEETASKNGTPPKKKDKDSKVKTKRQREAERQQDASQTADALLSAKRARIHQ